MKIVDGIRRDGYMFSKHTIVQDAGVIAALLPKRDFGRNLVLGVGGPVSRLEERQDKILACIGEGIARFLPRPDTSERKELGPSPQMKTSRP